MDADVARKTETRVRVNPGRPVCVYIFIFIDIDLYIDIDANPLSWLTSYVAVLDPAAETRPLLPALLRNLVDRCVYI